MKAKELKALNEQERKTKIVELYKELMKIKAQARTTPPKNPGSIRVLRRTIAQLKTPQRIQPTVQQTGAQKKQ